MDLNVFLALAFTNPSGMSTTINTDRPNDSFENTHLEFKGNEVRVGRKESTYLRQVFTEYGRTLKPISIRLKRKIFRIFVSGRLYKLFLALT